MLTWLRFLNKLGALSSRSSIYGGILREEGEGEKRCEEEEDEERKKKNEMDPLKGCPFLT